MAEFNSFHAPRNGSPLDLATLRKVMGKGPMFNYLKYFARRDVVTFWDDFLGDTLDTFWTAVATGGGAGSAAFAINVQENGWIRGTTGTANDATTTMSLIGPAIWYGDRNPGIEIRFKPITAVTETTFELGFVDVVPGSNKVAINNIATPTVNTSVVDAALYGYRHTGSTTTNNLVTIGSAISAAKVALTVPTAIAINTKYVVRIQLVGNQVACWLDGLFAGGLTTAGTDYVEGGDALAPWIVIQATNATSKSLDIDYVHIWADRN